MNRKRHDTTQFDDPARQREWRAQEAALRHEQLHLDPKHDDPRTLAYRLLARALKTEAPGALPDDFAQRVGALAAGSRPAPAATLESILTVILAGALAISAVAATATYGSTWWPGFAAWLPAPALSHWLVALTACVGLTWLVGAGSRLVTGSSRFD
jgi:hypothetical protein